MDKKEHYPQSSCCRIFTRANWRSPTSIKLVLVVSFPWSAGRGDTTCKQMRRWYFTSGSERAPDSNDLWFLDLVCDSASSSSSSVFLLGAALGPMLGQSMRRSPHDPPLGGHTLVGCLHYQPRENDSLLQTLPSHLRVNCVETTNCLNCTQS